MRVFDTWSLPDGPPADTVGDADPARPALTLRRARADRASADALLRHLRSARSSLVARPVREIARALGRAGSRFLDPDDALRREALELLPETAGLSPEMAREILDGMASDWTAARLERLLELELAGGAALDGFVAGAGGRRSRALGAALTVHLCAGSVPGVSVTSMVRALLVKSAVLLKPGRGDEVLPVLFRRALVDEADWLANATAVVYWSGGSDEPLEAAALEDADLVVVYGGDEAVRSVRARTRGTTSVVAYSHRVSFAVVGGALRGPARDDAAAQGARAVALFDQRGCVSPQLLYVLGSEVDAAEFAEALAAKLEEMEGQLPSGPLDERALAALQQVRGTAELLATSGRGRLWGGGRKSWTVLLDPDPAFEPSCLGRTVRVKPIASVEAILAAVRPFRRHLQTVGTAGLGEPVRVELAEGLSRLGPTRVAPLETAPWPPPWWHHDGMGPLGSLLRWSDLEGDG